MEAVVIIIMLAVVLSVLLKLASLPAGGRIAIALVCAVAVALAGEAAASQSKTQIEAWLQSPELMQDVAVLLTCDVFLQMTFCLTSARRLYGERESRWQKCIRLVAQWVPGLLIFPTLFALVVEAIFSLTGMDFTMVALGVAAAVFLLLAFGPQALKAALPETDLRLELIFMLNALIALLGIVATVNGRTAVDSADTLEWLPLAGVTALLLAGAGAGYLLYLRKLKK